MRCPHEGCPFVTSCCIDISRSADDGTVDYEVDRDDVDDIMSKHCATCDLAPAVPPQELFCREVARLFEAGASRKEQLAHVSGCQLCAVGGFRAQLRQRASYSGTAAASSAATSYAMDSSSLVGFAADVNQRARAALVQFHLRRNRDAAHSYRSGRVLSGTAVTGGDPTRDGSRAPFIPDDTSGDSSDNSEMGQSWGIENDTVFRTDDHSPSY
jgi:hypothetical protein